MTNSPTPITLLLGDVPPLVRLELTALLHAEPDLRVVGSASSATELIEQVRSWRPSLVVVSENQLTQLRWRTPQHAVPVLLYTANASLSAQGLPKVSGWNVYGSIGPLLPMQHPLAGSTRRILVRRVRAARQHLAVNSLVSTPRWPALPLPPQGVIVIGSSTGGPAAVEQIIRALPADLTAAVLVAVHLPAHFTQSFVARLRRATNLPVVVGEIGTRLEAGKIIVAPGGKNMVVQRVPQSPWLSWQTTFTTEPGCSADEPSVDLLMSSVARTAGRYATGVVLTGLGCDGTMGAQAIREQGGTVLVQDKASAAVFSMPGSVIRAGWANAVLALEAIPAYLSRHSVPKSTLFAPLVQPAALAPSPQ